ncbi:MAG TPA: ABC transporter substrate-binding protein [Polyangia bacterium]|nr:ABC transporter substrate-binding protein [Polyangia bacterium]
MKPLTLRSMLPRPSFSSWSHLRLFLIAVPLTVGMVTNASAQTPPAPAAAEAPAAKPKAAAKAAPKPAAKGKAGAGGAAGSADAAAKSEGKATTKAQAKSEPIPDKDTAPTTPPATASPMAELKKSNDQLDKLLKKKYPNWSPEAEAQKADVRKLVGGFLDYRELAHRALAKHWDGLTPAQRTDFVTTLRDLVERSYLKQVTGDPNYNIKYQKEEKTGSEAKVEATLATQARGKKVNIALEYHLIYKDHWFVYDVITDEQSMLENYRAEFNKIINKEGFDALLKRMKKKLDEKDG